MKSSPKVSGKILVPFSFESSLSGVGKKSIQMIRCGIGELLISQQPSGKDVIIHFEAVDYNALSG